MLACPPSSKRNTGTGTLRPIRVEADDVAPPKLRGALRPPGTFDANEALPDALAGDAADGVLHGRVIDEFGDPVAGAAIHCRILVQASSNLGDEDFTFLMPTAVADADGRFQLAFGEDERAGFGRTLAREFSVASAGGWSESRGVRPDALAPSEPLIFRVTRSENLQGTLYAEDGSPAAGVPVRASASEIDNPMLTETKSDGRFGLRIPPGSHTVDLEVGPFEDPAPWSSPHGLGVALPAVSVPDLNLRVDLVAAAELRGQVLDESANTVAAHVDILRLDKSLVPFRIRVNAEDGSFGPIHVRPGRYALRAVPHDARWASPSAPTQAAMPGPAVHLRARRPRVLRGRLLGEDVAGFRVLLVQEDDRFGPDRTQTVTDAEGGFALPCAGGPARLFANRRNDDRHADVQVPDQASPIDVVLEAGRRIQGVHAGGRPYSGARILARRDGVEVDAVFEEDGRFSLHGLSPGPWTLFVTKWTAGTGFAIEVGIPLHQVVEAGSLDVVIR